MDRLEATIIFTSIIYVIVYILFGWFIIYPIVASINIFDLLSLPLLQLIAVILHFTVGLLFFIYSIIFIIGMIAMS